MCAFFLKKKKKNFLFLPLNITIYCALKVQLAYRVPPPPPSPSISSQFSTGCCNWLKSFSLSAVFQGVSLPISNNQITLLFYVSFSNNTQLVCLVLFVCCLLSVLPSVQVWTHGTAALQIAEPVNILVRLTAVHEQVFKKKKKAESGEASRSQTLHIVPNSFHFCSKSFPTQYLRR